MKKLLYTLLAVSIIFSACEEDTSLPAANNNTNNNNSALAIGDSHQGGIIFYLDGNGGGLVAASFDQSTSVEWGCEETLISGADGTAIGTGVQNTIDIEAGCTTYGTAADICVRQVLGGYSDWFLPSKDELNEMYLNIGQGNALGLGNVGGFANNYYWSSSEYEYDDDDGDDTAYAWGQFFEDGVTYSGGKEYVNFFAVRAVRAF